MSRPPLPVDAILPALVESLRGHPCAVLVAPTGAGKTTRVPPALLDGGLGKVVVLEPRRLAARAAARRMVHERGGRLGDEVGYHVRFDRQVGPETRIAVLTEGILVRRLQDDPFLEGVGCVMFDEFHERSLETDLALAMVRRVQREAREELRIVVTSATLDVEGVACFLGDCPVLRSEGRLFPVEIEYLPPHGRERIEERMRRGVARALERSAEDLLAFLPGGGELRRCAGALEGIARAAGLDVLELYGDLPPDRQDAVLGRGPRRKLVLATNVAETSITIDGVGAVIDSGEVRLLRHDPAVGLDRLELGRISRASADQRAGRAGRQSAGHCVRLWSEMDQRSLRAHEEPEIHRLDLAGAALQLLAWGEADLDAFPWYEKPRPEALERARALLVRLDALTAHGLTAMGRRLARLPVHPRLGRLLLEGERRGAPYRAALAAAMLAERDPFRRPSPRDVPAHRDASDSDVLDRVRSLEEFARTGRGVDHPFPMVVPAARFVLRAAEQFTRMLRDTSRDTGRGAEGDEALLRSLLAAFPDRLAKRRRPGEPRARMVGGRGVVLGPHCAVTEAELFLCLDLDGQGADAVVRQASVVEREWLEEAHLERRVESAFDAERGRPVQRRLLLFEDLPLEESEHPLDDPAELEALLGRAAAADPAAALGLDRPEVAGYFARLAFLRQWLPELALPVIDADYLRGLVPLLTPGCRSLKQLAAAPLLDVVRGSLSHVQRQAVEREAPEKYVVPSGSHVRLHYEGGRPPVLAARLQELVGLERSPTVARGRVRLLLHLLAPNGRPQQVTDDLESFWTNTYAMVRKELRPRYPRHAWPEDPRTAPPERRPERRKR